MTAAADSTSNPNDQRDASGWFALALYSSLAVLLLGSVVGSVLLDLSSLPGWLGSKDWNAFLGQAQAELTSWFTYDQFPLWNPWRRGGQVSFAQPESMLLSPVTPLAALVGVLAAFKLIVIPLFLVGCYGFHAFAKTLGLHGFARFVPALMFFGSSVFPLYVSGGLPNWLHGLAILPWLVRSVWLCGEPGHERHVLIAGALHAFLSWCGSIHHFVFFPIVLGLVALSRAFEAKSVRPLVALALVFVVSIGIAAPRLLPMNDVHAAFPRETPPEGRFATPRILLATFLEPVVPWRIDLTSLDETWIQTGPGQAVQWVNVGSFVGPVAMLLALIGVFSARRRTLVFTVLALAFAWAALGGSVAPSLWRALHALPVYRSMQAPERLVMYVTFALAVLAGFGTQRVFGWLANRPRGQWLVFGTSLVGAFVAPMLWWNAPIADTAFDVAPGSHSGNFHGSFRQGPPTQLAKQWGGELYLATRENRGNPIGQSDIPTPLVVKAESDPGYRGEVHLASGGVVPRVEITPNEIHVTVKPAGADTLVVNQNWFPGWTVDGVPGGRTYARGGLIAVDVPAGEHHLVLRFTQPSVRRGIVLGGVGVALLVTGWFIRGSRARTVVLGAQCVVALLTVLSMRTSSELAPAAAPTYEARTWFVDAATTNEGEFTTIQGAIDAARPDDVVRIRPGRYAAFRLHKGVTLVADGDGVVSILGSAVIDQVPSGPAARVIGLTFGSVPALSSQGLAIEHCAGVVMLQSVSASNANGVAVRVRNCKRVHVFGGAIEGDSAPLVIEDSIMTLARVRMRVEAKDFALRAVRSMVFASDLDANAPTALEDDTSSVTRRGIGVPAASPLPPIVRVVDATFEGAFLNVECAGEPGATGFLLVGADTAYDDDPKSDGTMKRQVELLGNTVPLPVTIPASGTLKFTLPQPGGDRGLGSGCFVQLALETKPGTRIFALSLLDGALRTAP